MRSKAEVREDKALSKFMNKYKDILTREDMAQGGTPPQGPYFYQQNGKTYFSLPSHMVNGIMNCQHYHQMMQDCATEGIPVPHHVMAKDPQAHFFTPTQYLQEIKDQRIPPTYNQKVIEELAERSKNLPQEQQLMLTVLEFWDFERPPPPPTPGPSTCQ